MKRNLVYEIFVDRFAGDGGEPVSLGQGERPWEAHSGGTLDGIAARLEHMRSLGADALYLTPVFRAGSNHKYDTTSFDEVDPSFGGEAAFERLAAACKRDGTGLVLDGVFNHVGQHHGWFQRARESAESDTFEYFKWNAHPHSYNCWRGHRALPELNLDAPALLTELFEGDDSIIRRWLRLGATGWRLDCANDLGLQACSLATRVACEEHARDGITAEVMAFASSFAQPGMCDGVMNYYFRETVLSALRGEISAAQISLNFSAMAREYGFQQLLGSWNVLSTHDTPRLATVLPDFERRAFAFALAFAFPGVPLIYYGEEIGMTGGGDPDCRGPMIWDQTRWESSTVEFVRKLSRVRSSAPALGSGRYVAMTQADCRDLLCFARVTNLPEQTVIVVANASDKPLAARLFAPYSYLFDALPLKDLLGVAAPTSMVSGSFKVELAPWQVALYAPHHEAIPDYSFYS